MQLLDTDIAEFRALYKARTGIELDNQTARTKLSLLVRQMEIVHQPITKQQLEDLIIKDTRKRDAKALAELIYDVYQDSKRNTA